MINRCRSKSNDMVDGHCRKSENDYDGVAVNDNGWKNKGAVNGGGGGGGGFWW